MKAISVNIGLNKVNPGAYPSGKFPILIGAEKDAKSMSALALDNGFHVEPLITGPAANRNTVISAIEKAATGLDEGGIFLLTYSGHGSTHNNPLNDPNDRFIQTWCLFNGELTDKELYKLWSKFKPNTRILVISDSCYSGSVIKILAQYASLFYTASQLRKSWATEKMHLTTSRADILASVNASVILLASCQDDQKSKDADPSSGSINSRFTRELLDVWDSGSFEGNHVEFLSQIQLRFKNDNIQYPNYFTTGLPNQKFADQKPFTITTPI